jgi:hypothetical protein
MKCNGLYKKNDEYKQNRTGQRIGRRVIEELLGRELLNGEVVHHKDGNDMNNDPGNLIVFSSHSEHMEHHHGLRRARLNGTNSDPVG